MKEGSIARQQAAVAWMRQPGHSNSLLEGDGFYVSYNRTAGADKSNLLGDAAQLIGGIINGEGDPQEETALYDGNTWRILLGDYRKEYEQAFPSWEKCLAIYDKHKVTSRSGWSTDNMEEED